MPYFSNDRPVDNKISDKIAAHRGLSAIYPENSMLAFDAVYQIGLKWIEADISILADDTLIIFHDTRQGRIIPGKRNIAKLSWPDLQDADIGLWKGSQFAGQRVLRLEELLQWACEKSMCLHLEMKCPSGRHEHNAEVLASMLQGRNTENLVLSSFDTDFLYSLHKNMQDLRLASIHAQMPDNLDQLQMDLCLEAVHLHHKLIQSHDVVQLCKSRQLQLRVWTVNDAEMAHYLFDMGVDMVMSDCPDEIAHAMAKA